MKTFELILIGHSDKVCDGIAEKIKNANPSGRNAIEVCWFNENIIIGGETSKEWDFSDICEIVWEYLTKTVGLTQGEFEKITIHNHLQKQSAEINEVVGDKGAGDNGIFFGGWNKIYSPVIERMKEMCGKLDADRLDFWGYRTDGKFIFTVNGNGEIAELTLNIASKPEIKPQSDKLAGFVKNYTGDKTTIKINPRGDWKKCFGFADSGLTGRKLACDTQCGLFHNGGGAFFGKDESKADRSIPLFLQYLAKDIFTKFSPLENIELSASTIIGDAKVKVFYNGTFYKEFDYAKIMDFARKNPIDIFGRQK